MAAQRNLALLLLLIAAAVAAAIILVVLIIFAFLRDFRSTLIVSTAIPISVIGTFALLYFGGYTPGVVTGKPIALGGSQGRGEATARGCLFTIREACKTLKIKLKGARVAVQGFGNVGGHLARSRFRAAISEVPSQTNAVAAATIPQLIMIRPIHRRAPKRSESPR